MEIRSTTLSAYFESLKTTFNDAYTSPEPTWPQIAMRIDSNTETNVYGWMEQLPQLRKWVGSRVFHNLKSNGYSLTNDDYEFSLSVDRNKLEDDQYGIYAPMMRMAGDNAAFFPDIHIYDLMNNGFTTTYGTCWDGKAFFAADHTWKPDANGDATTLNNLSDLALTDANFATVRALLKQNLQGGDSPFMSRTPELVLVVGTNLENTGKKILEADYNELGATNVNKGTATLLVNAQMDDLKWILMVKNNPIMPFIYQVRKEVEVKDNLNSSEIEETREFKLMAHGRFAFGYSLPALAYGSTGNA